MKVFRWISTLLYMHLLKHALLKGSNKGLTEEEAEHLSTIKRQNPFGLVVLILGGASFTFGPVSLTIPVTTIILFLISFGTFDKNREDNPWTFYIGLGLSFIGLWMNINEMLHEHHLR
ncbi:hypothetical protein FIU87_04815 [Bacillus sp. THAF10]|uniref:cell division protein FtsK n=1 Tax=Bacillus sp. THAF10 TaxID=2587848 RepID=UPI001268AD3D|nr:cell division protein FtsK [Bacillus sp. THAF10]QFT87971.1 hypothetical protein FIU87_04815 [Bacillus sp. THAF10]